MTERLIVLIALLVALHLVTKWLFGHYRLHIVWDEVFGWSWWISDDRHQ